MQIVKPPMAGKTSPSFLNRLGQILRPEPNIPTPPARPAPASSETNTGVAGKAGASVGGAAPRVSGSVSAGVGSAISRSSGTSKAGSNASAVPAATAKAAVQSASAGAIGSLLSLNETQRAEANLVAKLPSEFPLLQWETLNTKSQQKVMQHSGLSPQEQWRLLKASTPLEVLSLVNAAQQNKKSGLITAREANDITDRSLRYADTRQRLASGDASILPPLQKGLWN